VVAKRVFSLQGLQQLAGAKDQQGSRHVAELKRRHAHHEPAQPASQHRPHPQPQRLPLPLLGPWSVADGVHDGQGGQQARDDRQGNGAADPNQPDQGQREQGAGDGAQVVAGSLEPIGPPVHGGRHDVGQQGVAGRDPQPAGGPGAGPQHPDLPDGGGGADEAGEDGGGGVAAHREGAAAAGVVSQGAPSQPGDASQAVGDAFDEAEGGGGGAEGGGEQVGQQRGGDLVADIGQEAGRADPGHSWAEPALVGCCGIGHGVGAGLLGFGGVSHAGW
jgi:hypothetical protein